MCVRLTNRAQSLAQLIINSSEWVQYLYQKISIKPKLYIFSLINMDLFVVGGQYSAWYDSQTFVSSNKVLIGYIIPNKLLDGTNNGWIIWSSAHAKKEFQV